MPVRRSSRLAKRQNLGITALDVSSSVPENDGSSGADKSVPTSTTTTTTTHLLDLPPELLEMILQLVLHPHVPQGPRFEPQELPETLQVRVAPRRKTGNTVIWGINEFPAVVRVCKALREISLPIHLDYTRYCFAAGLRNGYGCAAPLATARQLQVFQSIMRDHTKQIREIWFTYEIRVHVEGLGLSSGGDVIVTAGIETGSDRVALVKDYPAHLFLSPDTDEYGVSGCVCDLRQLVEESSYGPRDGRKLIEILNECSKDVAAEVEAGQCPECGLSSFEKKIRIAPGRVINDW